MGSETDNPTLEEVADIRSGGTPSKSRVDYWLGNIPWVSAKDMKKFRIFDTLDHISKDGLENGTRLVAKETTLILTRGMTLLSDVPICVAECNLAFNQDVKAIIPRAGIVPRYLTYALLAAKPQLKETVELAGHGTGRLPSDLLRSLRIRRPKESEQKAIAHILGALDDKIENNRRMNETLEGMARAVFKSWFVDFDPVRAKEKINASGAKGARGAGVPGMDAAVAALFPDSFVDSELGRIPKGWRERNFAEIAILHRETINPSMFPNETFDHYSIPAFDEGRLPKTEKGNQIQSNKFVVPSDSVMISKLNPRIPRVWLSNIVAIRRSISSTEFLVALPKFGISREWLYGLFGSKEFVDVFTTLVTGTSGSHQRVKPEYLLSMKVVIPKDELIMLYARTAKPLYKQVALHLEESRTLAAIRDALLPKLLSGEIRVKDAEKFVEERV